MTITPCAGSNHFDDAQILRPFGQDGDKYCRTRASARKGGFTIVELLVAVAIMGILAAVLVPAVNKGIEKSRTASGLSNLRQIGSVIHLYVAENDGYLPPGYLRDPDSPDKGIGSFSTFLSAMIQSDGKGLFSDNIVVDEIFRDPGAEIDGGTTHFSTHPKLMVDQGQANSSVTPQRINSVKRPTEMILVMDAVQDENHGGIHVTTWRMDGRTYNTPYSSATADTPIDPGNAEMGNIRWSIDNGTKAKFLFVDGHVEIRAKEEVLKRNVQL